MAVLDQTGLYYLQQLSVFLGFPLLISGLIGNIFCVIVFLSLRTFKKSSCSFYLMFGCFISIFKLAGGLFPRLMILGFKPEWAASTFYCKFLTWLCQFCSSILLTCLCLATLDHYFATSHRPAWRRFSNLRTAYRMVTTTSSLWILHAVPYMLVWSIQDGFCVLDDSAVATYFRKVYFPILLGVLPVVVMNLFSLLCVYNMTSVHKTSVMMVAQRELDRQLTKMLVTQVIFVSVMTVLFMGHSTYLLNATLTDAATATEQQAVNSFLYTVWYLSYSVRF